jgi:hypothetical protein
MRAGISRRGVLKVTVVVDTDVWRKREDGEVERTTAVRIM